MEDKKISAESIYLKEIQAVKANRFLTASEKAEKIKELEKHINK